MEVTAHASWPVVDRSHVPVTRHEAQRTATRAGFDETEAHRVGLVATELASNLAKHTSGGGQLLIRGAGGVDPCVELLAIDRGPGSADVTRSLGDGHSTSGSSGTGLGAAKRLADDFDIYSQPGKGTVVLARLRASRAAAAATSRMRIGGISVAMPGETVCGDAWTSTSTQGQTRFVLVDGLGHGVYASDAASAAVRLALARPHDSALDTLKAMHEGTRHTRGAAATVALLDLQSSTVSVSGVGNVSAAIVGLDKTRQAVSLNGTLGHDVRQFREYKYPWEPGAMLVMHSDGLASHWSVDAYPGIRRRDPVLAAALLFRDHQRGRDDVTVVVAAERT